MNERPTIVPPTFGDFLVWLLLGMVTLGIYTLWWQYRFFETMYRYMKASTRDARADEPS